MDKWKDKLKNRVLTENYARDSFQNILYSLFHFKQVTGKWPQQIKIINWGFKEKRFDFHRKTLGIEADKYKFLSINNPDSLANAQKGEQKTLHAFRQDPYGVNPNGLGKKRADRNPHGDAHPYSQIPEVRQLLNYLENPTNEHKLFEGTFPWNQGGEVVEEFKLFKSSDIFPKFTGKFLKV